MPERRGAQRLPLKAKIRTYLVQGTALTEHCSGWTQDVSIGGLRFLARKPVPMNATVEMEIACTRPVESCRLRGQVGWLGRENEKQYVVGVFVREPSAERLVAWRRILTRRGLLE